MMLQELATCLVVVSLLVGESSLAATADAMVVAMLADSKAERRNISAAIDAYRNLGRFVLREYYRKYLLANAVLDRGV